MCKKFIQNCICGIWIQCIIKIIVINVVLCSVVDGEGGSNIGLIIGLVIGALLLFVGGVILVVAVVYHNIKQRSMQFTCKSFCCVMV